MSTTPVTSRPAAVPADAEAEPAMTPPSDETAASAGVGQPRPAPSPRTLGPRTDRKRVKHLATRAHAFIYRHSQGRILGHVGGQPVLLLQTIGRRSGQARTTPVQYLPADGAFVVVAANAGAARPPSWYLNLCADAHATVRIGTRDIAVEAREVHDSERDTLWLQLTAANRYMDSVARKAGRLLPVLVLAPTTPQ